MSKADEIFKELVWDNMVTAVLESFYTAVPVLRVPPLSTIISWAFRALTDKLYAVLDLAWDLTVIVIRNEQLRRDYDRAAVSLKIIRHDYGVDSKRYLEARDVFRKELAEFVRIRPAA